MQLTGMEYLRVTGRKENGRFPPHFAEETAVQNQTVIYPVA